MQVKMRNLKIIKCMIYDTDITSDLQSKYVHEAEILYRLRRSYI